MNTQLISANDMKKFNLTPNSDGTYNKDDIEEMLNQKATIYNSALEELKSAYEAINVQEEQKNQDIEQLKILHSEEIDKYKQEIESYKEQSKDYERDSQLLTQLTVEARTTLNKAKDKAKEIEDEAHSKANSIKQEARDESAQTRKNADEQSSQIIENAKVRARDYEDEQVRNANEKANSIKQKANDYKVEQENQINELRQKALDSNEHIINEGSEKAKSLITQAQNKANAIIDEAQKNYDEIAHEVSKTRQAGVIMTRHMKKLSDAFDGIKELESYKILNDITERSRESREKVHTKDQKEIKQDSNSSDDQSNVAVQQQAAPVVNEESKKDVSNVLNYSNIDFDSISEKDFSQFPKAIQNSLETRKAVMNELNKE